MLELEKSEHAHQDSHPDSTVDQTGQPLRGTASRDRRQQPRCESSGANKARSCVRPADAPCCRAPQLKRHESGASKPTIEVFRRIDLALNVSADMLLFEPGERAPDERLTLQFKAVSKLDEKERDAVETMIAGVLHMQAAKRWATNPTPGARAKTEEPKR
jgi:hypothetical protein